MQVISREEAKASGLKRYYTGVPCQNGHDAERYVSKAKCCKCLADRKRDLYRRKTGSVGKVRLTEDQKRSKIRKLVADWKKSNPEKVAEQKRRYRKNNPQKRAAEKAKRRASKLNATPSWLTKEQLAQIEAIYLHAQIWTEVTGVPYHVDHIIPLQGTHVCGLHVPWNLRVMKGEDNVRKSNKVEEDACG